MTDLAKALSKRVIRRLAGDRFYDRGVDYLRQGRVEALHPTPAGLLATVQGEKIYQVRLEQDDEGEWTYSCTCPIGGEGFFCKHCAAAALAFLEGAATAKTIDEEPPRGLSAEEAVDLLLSQDREVLRTTLLRWAEINPWLEGRIYLHAANAEAPTAAWKAVLSTFRENLIPDNFSSEDEWVESFLSSCDMLDEGLELGMAEMIIDLCEAGLDVAAEEMAALGGPTEDGERLLEELQAIHLRACKRAKPNPIALSERLFEWEKRSVFDVFFDGARTYRKLLGSEGLQRTRELAEKLWKKNKHNGPDNEDVVTAVMVLESLAEMTGNVDDRAAAMALDLSSPNRYAMIAELYIRKGKLDRAIEWLERGRRAFPADANSRLSEALAQLYVRADRRDDAAAVAHEAFDANPSSHSYMVLRIFAEKHPRWKEWADKAVTRVRAEQAKPNGKLKFSGLLVEILTQEARLDEAWDAAEGEFLAPQVWLALAGASVETHPAYAAGVYVRCAEQELSGEGSSSRYKRAVELLEQGAACMQRAGKTSEFMLALQDIQRRYKRRRKLQELIGQRWKHLDLRPKTS